MFYITYIFYLFWSTIYYMWSFNMFRYILVGKTYCLHVIFERYIDKLFKLVDYCNNK